MGENNVVATKAAPVLFHIILHQYKPLFLSAIPTEYLCVTSAPACTVTASTDQFPTKIVIPKSLYQQPSGSENKIQIAHDQQMVLAQNPNLPTIATVVSYQRPVFEQAIMTRITPGCAKTFLRDWTTVQNSQKTSMNLNIFNRTLGHS